MTTLDIKSAGRPSGHQPRRPAGALGLRIWAGVIAVSIVVSTGYLADAIRDRGVTIADGTAIPVATEFRQAEALRLIKGLEANPNRSAGENTLLGRLYLQQAKYVGDIGLFREADAAFGAALEVFPTSVEALTHRAKAAASVHEFERSLALAVQALDLDPSRLDAQLAAADALEPLGDIDGAEVWLGRVAAVAGSDPAVQVRYARIAHLRGDDESALAFAVDAERQSSESITFAIDAALFPAFHAKLLLDAGRYDEAQSIAEAAVAVSPESGDARMVLALALAAQGDISGAIDQVGAALRGGIAHPEDLALLGDLHMRLGNVEQAEAFYAGVDDFETGPVFSRQIATSYANRGVRSAEALQLAERDLEIRKDIYGYDTYAWALYRSGRFGEAREASDTALTLGTQDAALYYHAGLISAALGEVERAVGELERALTISPHFHPLLADHALAALDQLT